MEAPPAELSRTLDEAGRGLLKAYLLRERQSWLALLEGLHSDLDRELERARESMPEDAPRAGGDHFLWEEESREYEALAGLATLQIRLEQQLKELKEASGTGF